MIWGALVAIAALGLLVHSGSKNAVWGTATLGALIGVVVATFRPGFDWWLVGKFVAISTFIGLALEWLPRLLKQRPPN
jgi:hypothetical protein